MNPLKTVQTILATLLLVLAFAHGQDYFNDDDSNVKDRRVPLIPVVRTRRQGELGENQRYRRQGGGHEGVTGPVHTFVKTDEHAHFKWGVRHHVGHEYAGRR